MINMMPIYVVKEQKMLHLVGMSNFIGRDFKSFFVEVYQTTINRCIKNARQEMDFIK